MYCGQCGKKIMDNMLFCPFCGTPVVIPEQDEEAKVAQPAQLEQPVETPVKEQRNDGPVSLFDSMEELQESRDEEVDASQSESCVEAQPEEEEVFVPLSFEQEDGAELSSAEEAVTRPEVVPEFISSPAESNTGLQDADIPPRRMPASVRPVQRSVPRELKRPEAPRKQAFIPVKDVDLDNMFMDDVDAEDDYDGDDYDLDQGSDRGSYYDRDFEFEEPEHGSFVQRHIRGIVCLILLLILAIVFFVWMFSNNGQRVLASANLAWKAQPYADLGYEAYQQNNDLQAARYYERALERDSKNYEYAHSAMVAYYEADEIESAAAMLKKCIEMDPDNPEPYHEMLILYPDAATRPWEIQELIRLGFQRTGDQSLNVAESGA